VPDSYSHEVHSVHIVGAYYVPEQPLYILSVRDVLHINGAVIFYCRDGLFHVRWNTERGDVRQRMVWRRNLP
jgi:hypothetical protein